MGITNSNKELNKDHIDCGGTFKVTLSLTAEPNIASNPVDIVLILDRSQKHGRQSDRQSEKRGEKVHPDY